MQAQQDLVVVDPGHGGTDRAGKSTPFGAQSAAGLQEKTITLTVAERVAGGLPGRARATRTGDVNASLGHRIEVARAGRAPVFVSLHADQGAPERAGSEVWIHDRAGAGSHELARAIQRALAGAGPTAAYLLQGELAVLSPERHFEGTAACLVALDDVARPEGERRLSDPHQLERLGDAIRQGIEAYLGRGAAYGQALQSITHAGNYRLAYDRLGTLGVIEPLPGRDTRRFRGTAELQNALDAWAPYIERVMTPPAFILTGGLYVDKPGEHGRGNAVDVDGFWWSDSDTFLAIHAPTDWYRYLTIEATLRKVFGTVLNYDYNAAHHDHWHCDLGRNTSWRRAESQVKFVQRALREIWGEDIEVDGGWGDLSRGALARAGYDFGTGGGWDHFLDDLIARQSTPRP
ncbi:MAG: N-acetylmuramoyl-L-alanine amidase [Planctomycetota bacterium]